MSRETEKVFRKLDAFLAQHEPADEEELNALVQQFMNAHNEAIRLGQAEADPEDPAVLLADEDVPRHEHLCPGSSSFPQ